MPKRNSLTYDNKPETNQILPDIDIADFLFSNNDSPFSNELPISYDKPIKQPNLIRSPLRSQENLLQNSSKNQSSSSSQQIPIFSNFGIHDHDENNSHQIKNPNQKSLKNKLYAKNYRQKKKQRLTILQQENRFLKSKIDDLSFRLKQAEIQLNKFKHNHQSNTQNYQTARESLMREIQKILQKQESNTQKLLQLENELRKLNAFDSKHRMDLLNYFMSELLQNLINDMGFYFVQSLVEKKGIWRVNENFPYSKIDLQIKQIVGQQQWVRIKLLIDSLPPMVLDHFVNFKVLWKNLYEDYLNIINQGTLIETMCQSLSQHGKENLHREVLNALKLQLYFQKIKYRKDMRQLRESWFHDQQNQQKSSTVIGNKKVTKKIKLIH